MDLDIIQNICILIGQEEYSIGGILLSVSVMNSDGKNRNLLIKNKFIGIIYTLINQKYKVTSFAIVFCLFVSLDK